METPSRCPFSRGATSAGKKETPNPVPPNPPTTEQPWRPRSSRQGISPAKYVLWNSFYWVLETLNRGLARDPNRKISWDKWPPIFGLLYLMAKIRFNRSNALTDPYDYKTNDNRHYGPETTANREFVAADGSWVADDENPQMGAANTRFGSNIPPKRIRPDVENITPSARRAGKLRWRKLDPETGAEITKPAGILNVLAGAWIQKQAHGFAGNTKRDPVSQCPYIIARAPDENWPDNVAFIDRTTVDPTRIGYNDRPTPINERTIVWIQSEVYGTNPEEEALLRSFTGGKLKVDENQHLPEDPTKPGIDLVGFNNNYNPMMGVLHWMFVLEHNQLCDHYAFFHPDWDEETLFQMARQANFANIARIHTDEWTRDLLQHPTLQLGMHADWYGLIGKRAKLYLMRFFDRHPVIAKHMTWLRNNETLWGMPGSKRDHHDGPFQTPVQFRMVYRLHEMVLGTYDIVDPRTDRTLDRIELLDFVQRNTRGVVSKFGYETLAYSFTKASCGALTLHNFPRALTQFANQQDGVLTDLAERDLFREREDGTGTYNEFRNSLGESSVTSFLELTGGNVELARELEICYEGDVNKVDAGIGILAEPKPDGFALGFVQFYQFVLNAPRRVKSNRELTDNFHYAHYKEGMDWVEHSGGILGVMRRHLPGLRANMEGVIRGFTPWLETETFPLRMLTKTQEDTGRIFKHDLVTLLITVVASSVAVWTGVLPLWLTLTVLCAMAVGIGSMTVKRMLAMRYMQQVWQKCYTDKRGFMFGRLYKGEAWLNLAARCGRYAANLVSGLSAYLCVATLTTHPICAALFALLALRGLSTAKLSNSFAADAQVLKVSLRNRMRAGQPKVEDELPKFGAKPLSKRYWFLEGDHANTDVTGVLDLAKLDHLFRSFAPGRDYLTAYDFDRMHEANRVQRSREGRGKLTGFFRQHLAGLRTDQLLRDFADLVVEQDHELVPAISKEMLVRFYNGFAQLELVRERKMGDVDPSPLHAN